MQYLKKNIDQYIVFIEIKLKRKFLKEITMKFVCAKIERETLIITKKLYTDNAQNFLIIFAENPETDKHPY